MVKLVPYLILRVAAFIVAGATTLLLLTGVIGEDFVVPDVALITSLVTGALLGESAMSRAWLLAAFAATAGVFSVSAWQSFVDAEPNWRTTAGSLLVIALVVWTVASYRSPSGRSESAARGAERRV